MEWRSPEKWEKVSKPGKWWHIENKEHFKGKNYSPVCCGQYLMIMTLTQTIVKMKQIYLYINLYDKHIIEKNRIIHKRFQDIV